MPLLIKVVLVVMFIIAGLKACNTVITTETDKQISEQFGITATTIHTEIEASSVTRMVTFDNCTAVISQTESGYEMMSQPVCTNSQ